MQYTLNAQLLLLLINKADNAKGRIPGKLFELMRAKRPILGLGVLGGDVHKIIQKSATGEYYDYEDYKSIKSFLKEKYSLFEKGENKIDSKDIEEYSVENQTRKIGEYLDEIIK